MTHMAGWSQNRKCEKNFFCLLWFSNVSLLTKTLNMYLRFLLLSPKGMTFLACCLWPRNQTFCNWYATATTIKNVTWFLLRCAHDLSLFQLWKWISDTSVSHFFLLWSLQHEIIYNSKIVGVLWDTVLRCTLIRSLLLRFSSFVSLLQGFRYTKYKLPDLSHISNYF